MDKAAYGLIGVVLGVVLTVAKEWWFQNRENKKNAEYLAIQIISMLDRFVSGCAAVVSDDGLYHGRPDKDGCSQIQVKVPKLEPEAAKVEWRSLPAGLMYEVLTFPNKVEVANNRIDAEFEYSAFPPDYSEGFEERQFQYAGLGIDADRLASKLRVHASLPAKPKSDYDPVEYMKGQLETISNRRIERTKRK